MLLVYSSAFFGAAQAFVILHSNKNHEQQHHHTKLSMAKKMKFTIKENLAGSISSDGVFEGRETKERPLSSKLGVPSKQKNKNKAKSAAVAQRSSTSKSSLSKKERQRTGNGNVDSTLSTRIAAPEKEEIQVVEAKRGGKSVTIVRGMTSPMETRKGILKELKKSLGVGGTLLEGVLEIQGAYADKTVEVLHKKGYVLAKKIGK